MTATTPKTSLYSLTIQQQEIDGELAIAMAKLTSGDEAEQAEADEMIAALLQRASQAGDLLAQKANAICHIREGLLAKASYLREVSADRLEKAQSEEKAAERLLEYLVRCLSALHPGQKKFALPEYTVSSRPSEKVEVDEEDLPDEYKRFEIKIKLSTGFHEAVEPLIAAVTYTLAQLEILPHFFDVSVSSVADKAALKPLLASGEEVPGAGLMKRTNWSIK
jgi:hypothetical protein